MRVFDTYDYNIIDKVKFKDTKKYVDKMLSKVGMAYNKVGFGLQFGDMNKVIAKYPELQKYCCWEDDNNIHPGAEMSEKLLTSYSKNWTKGKVYANREDWNDIFELFAKIPRPFNFLSCDMFLHGINWYEDSNATVAIYKAEGHENKPLDMPLYFIGNGIRLHKSYDYGNKLNVLDIIVEATTDSIPRDTSDISKKLAPYLGEPFQRYRECWFSEEELERKNKLEEKYNAQINDLFQSMVGECQYEYSEIPNEPTIYKLCDKKTINNTFKGSGFQVGDRAGLLPGMNDVVYKDEHNYQYEIGFDRGTWGNWFGFNIRIKSYNFDLELSQKNFGSKSKEEATGKINEIAKFVVAVRDEICNAAVSDFGECPEGYLVWLDIKS